MLSQITLYGYIKLWVYFSLGSAGSILYISECMKIKTAYVEFKL